jgi:2-C-methyl-D-erythritol 2,4-cyclodiphosphate synthase
MMDAVRIGQGFDVHAFSDDEGRRLVLGGVEVDGPGLSGHSDGDVIIHAIVDALLGAAAIGDLGTVFGVDDPAYAGAASTVFLTEAVARVQAGGWRVGNVDCTVVAQRPRLEPYRRRITENLGVRMAATGAVSVKATTTDGLGFLGRGEGIACMAVVLLQRA